MRLILALFLTFALGCSGPSFQERLLNQAESAISNQKTVAVDAISNSDWDAVYFFTPYTPESVIDHDLGFKWRRPLMGGFGDHDSISLMLFVKGNNVKQSYEIRRPLHFDLKQTNKITRTHPFLEVEKRGERIILRPQRPQ